MKFFDRLFKRKPTGEQTPATNTSEGEAPETIDVYRGDEPKVIVDKERLEETDLQLDRPEDTLPPTEEERHKRDLHRKELRSLQEQLEEISTEIAQLNIRMIGAPVDEQRKIGQQIAERMGTARILGERIEQMKNA
ncbi:MAG TPA: hypothetical protein VEA18_03470 [Candidatus Kapabacteria bacterium]|nr:hypothetical protein [Candidatus Kapabacteria bacterium]